MYTKKIKTLLLAILLSISLIVPQVASAKTAKDSDEFVQALYDAISKRESKTTITYTGSDREQIFDNFDDLLTEAYQIDDDSTSSDADYIQGIFKSWKLSRTGNVFTISFSYHETLKETQEVDAKIAQVLKSLGVSSMSDYGKIKAIHDYIVKNVEYDTDLKKFSAYDGLINKSTVCNGYALLFYKMLTEAGVPCKIVTGLATTDGTQTLHAWNIVELKNKWYMVDTTWDDPIGGTKVYYDYFLKGSKTFDKDHMATDQFSLEDVLEQYTIAEKNYTPTASDIKMLTKASLKVSKTKTITLPIPEKATVKWKSSNTKIATVSTKGKITAKAKGTATITATVTMPDSTVKKITTKVTVTK
ncbi:transglutaminase domain-containing protein [Anaerosporobacter sp.]|uniref:transglutaminase domain-containing protein n=1 Tax=Anaerosporobacter sp. TaxID=1872529 RepID=UPI00286EBE03|nr:transglutaminase domain-containing protein [Anaerosporobacter sp.]